MKAKYLCPICSRPNGGETRGEWCDACCKSCDRAFIYPGCWTDGAEWAAKRIKRLRKKGATRG